MAERRKGQPLKKTIEIVLQVLTIAGTIGYVGSTISDDIQRIDSNVINITKDVGTIKIDVAVLKNGNEITTNRLSNCERKIENYHMIKP